MSLDWKGPESPDLMGLKSPNWMRVGGLGSHDYLADYFAVDRIERTGRLYPTLLRPVPLFSPYSPSFRTIVI